MKTNDAKDDSLLTLAAVSGGENAFQTVLGALHEALDGNEVRPFKLGICALSGNRNHHSK